MTPLERLLGRLPDAAPAGTGWSARCPAHEDRRASLSVGEGADGRALVHCHAGCTTDAVCAALGLAVADLMPAGDTLLAPSRQRDRDRPAMPGGRTYATARAAVAALERRHGPRSAMWVYRDAHGAPVGVVVRWDRPGGGKDIRPVSRHADGWRVGGMPEPRPLYGLPGLVGAQRVYITEGEKAADAVRSLGLAATTSAHGAQSAAQTDWTPLAGRDVVVLPDHDAAGERYAEDVVRLCRAAGAASVRVLRLRDHAPGLPPGGDAADVVACPQWCGLPLGEAAEPPDAALLLDRLADAVAPAAPVWTPDDENDGPAITPKLVVLSSIKPTPVRWLWLHRIPLGKLTMVVGDPSAGKSTLAIDIAARVSTGTDWPDGGISSGPGGVVLLSAEDDPADTIRPRLDAAGADVSRVAVLTAVVVRSAGAEREQHFSLARDLPSLENAIGQVRDCKLVVVDPISAYLGDIDSHKNAAVRGLLAPLAELAARYGVAVVLVEHLNKRAGGPAMYRPGGSIAFAAAARAVWSVSRSEDDREVRLMLPVKANLARDLSGMAYTIVDSPDVPGVGVIAWSAEPVTMTADEALAGADDGDRRGAMQEAVEWLRDRLADGPRPSGPLKIDAKRDGIAARTLDRARRALGVIAAPDGFGGAWAWSLPEAGSQSSPTSPQFANTKTLANTGDGGELWTGVPDEWGEV